MRLVTAHTSASVRKALRATTAKERRHQTVGPTVTTQLNKLSKDATKAFLLVVIETNWTVLIAVVVSVTLAIVLITVTIVCICKCKAK